MAITRREFCRSALTVPSAVALLLDGPPAGAAAELPPRANYMLRYFIRSDTAKQQTEGLIAYCKQNHMGEVLLFNGNYWDMGWNLPTLVEAKVRVEALRPVFKRLREAGIVPSINMLTTLGHGDYDRDERSRFSWQFMVGDDGAESRAIPCPIDPQYKVYVGKLYGMFASLQPAIIYIDDDYRLHNHSPVSWACFCPLHLEEVGRRLGRKITREELVHQICTAWPQPTVERKAWLELSGDTVLEDIRIMSEAVKAASPNTHMGQMCSAPNVHAAEGRRWLDNIKAFSLSGNQPVIRPNYASYSEALGSNVPVAITNMRKLQPLLGSRVRITPELENYPYTRISKSVALTRLQMALSFFLAPPDLTLNVLPFTETRFDYDPAHDRMFRESYAYFNGITAWASECRKERGVQVLWDDRFPLHRRIEVDRVPALPAPNVWEGVLDLMGFATTFFPEEVKLASRFFLEERTDDEVNSLLKGKLLLDGEAAEHLVERGFGPQIGVKSCQPAAVPANYERFTNAEFAGKYANRDDTLIGASKYRLQPVANAIIVSTMFGPEASFTLPGMMVSENTGGGRVGIIPLKGSAGNLMAFRSWKRQAVVARMLEWINRRPLPLVVEDAPAVFPLRRDGAKSVLIGIGNLSVDALPEVRFRTAPLGQGAVTVEYLGADGKVSPLQAKTSFAEGYLWVQASLRVRPLDFVCFRLKMV